MFGKILIANRGEIALRIIRACRELGIQTVAVYSEADEQSLHVQLADGAICIGPAPSQESYLRADRIISAAEISDVDAIHPGYGFLAEDADFAEQCESCGIAFIGPRSAAIREMGDKARAKEVAKKANVPVVPGSDGPIDEASEAMEIAKRLGYPVIIKAVAGGGGRGMRLSHNPMSFAREFATARLEAEKAFGDGRVYLEKYIEDPRHIEFQIFGDTTGQVVHLGERDCSVQRRHQKVIEEAPSPAMTPELRAKMGEAAIAVAQVVQYTGAGTIEFLLDRGGQYYFLEMNTRIQVEHGVTEEAMGVDLVKEQIRVAFGAPLSFRPEDLQFKQHAIEVRICAENPLRNFSPCPGEISLYYSPGGHGVRVDSHVYGGYTIPPFYDSMIAKVIATGQTRQLALDRMYRALNEYLIRGIDTNISFAKAVVRDPIFVQGGATTRFIEDFFRRTPKELFTNP